MKHKTRHLISFCNMLNYFIILVLYIYCLFIKYVCHIYHIIITLSIQLCGFLTEVVIDQLPNLLDLKHFLIQLAVTDPAVPEKDLILEEVFQHSHTVTNQVCCQEDIYIYI